MGTPEFEFLNTDLIEYFIITKLENTSIGIYRNTEQRISIFCCHNFFFFGLFVFLGPHPQHMGGSQARGQSELVVSSLCQSHSHARNELCLQPTP